MFSDLQQTPVTAAKASIKIVVNKTPGQTEAHAFTFTSATARDDQQATTGVLRKWIEAHKAQAAPTPAAATPTPDGGAAASLAIARTVVGTPKPNEGEDTYDDAKLMADIELQRSLLHSNPALQQRFNQSLSDKPDTISLTQFSNQFWTTRVHMLRSHVVERSQGAGAYNVLSVVKPQIVNGVRSLAVSKEQIQLLFSQHPLIKKVYNENVPRMSNQDFWSRFFNSRLLKKLKGEKITDNDPPDPRLDTYLTLSDDVDTAPQLVPGSIPHFLDVEGNEQNHSQRQGNRPDMTMRPNAHDKVPILRVLNSMSEKMMAEVPPSDSADRHGPAGVDEETYKQLQLRDLQLAAKDNRIILNIKDQGQIYSAGQGLHTSSSAATYAKRTPADVLSEMRQQINNIPTGQGNNGGINLESAIGVVDESSSDEENSPAKKKAKVGSRSSRSTATSQITKAIYKRHALGEDFLLTQVVSSSSQALKLGISEQLFDSLAMTHNTTVEFLHYFWAVYYSGDADRANEVAKLIETLDKSLDRIKAVADAAEGERTAKIEKTKQDNEAFFQRSGRRRKFDSNNVKGGAKAVNGMVEPLRRAIDAARKQYQTVLNEQLGRAAGQL
jgi:transcription initiation factor TFIIH subunit 1